MKGPVVETLSARARNVPEATPIEAAASERFVKRAQSARGSPTEALDPVAGIPKSIRRRRNRCILIGTIGPVAAFRPAEGPDCGPGHGNEPAEGADGLRAARPRDPVQQEMGSTEANGVVSYQARSGEDSALAEVHRDGIRTLVHAPEQRPDTGDGVLRLADEGRIDTVQIDLKDDTGTVGYDSEVPRAHEIGAVTPHYDLDEAVALLDERGVRVIGRIAAFRDPKLVDAAWGAGQADQVIQSVRGGPYETLGKFTNPASAAVRRYNLDIAIDAVSRGVDDILWDDVRLPTGEPDMIVVPGLTASPSDVVTGFLAESHSELRRRGAYQGVTTVGMAADTGDPIGQDVARMARNADYLSPQIYPGYWAAGRYGVPDPPHMPAEFTVALLTRYQEVTAGTGVVMAPWLQAFELESAAYGDNEVRAMIGALHSLGVDRFLLWSPRVQYPAGALDPVS